MEKNKLKIDFKATTGYQSKEEHYVTKEQFIDIQNVLNGSLSSQKLDYWKDFETNLNDFVEENNTTDEVGEFILDFFDLWK